MVNQSKQRFHCFGCGVGGDIISFLIKYENFSFHEAKNFLAKRAGISLPERKVDRKALEKKEKIRCALADAMNYYAKRLSESKPARDFLKMREMSEESIRLFHLGYAPSGWSNLLTQMRDSGYSDSVIKDAGLAVSGNKGLYDMFRERIIFPIMSISGKVIAFGGRTLNDAMPKYINSPETSVYKKSDTLFGLYTARETIRSKGFVIIVEGYMDVIICHQYGFKNVIAPLGTSLTSGQLQKLRTLTNKAVIVFDGDTAGISAAKRALILMCENDFKPRVLLLPDNQDPDSYLRKYGNSAFSAMLGKAKSVIDFILSVSNEDKIDTVREALSLMAVIKDLLVTGEMLTELSDKTGLPEIEIRQEFRKIKNKAFSQKSASSSSGSSKTSSEEYLLLSAVITFPEKSDYVISRIDLNEIKNTTVGSLLRRIASVEDKKDLTVILDKADEHEREIYTKLSVDPGFDIEYVDRIIEDCLRRIEKKKLDERMLRAGKSGDLKLIHSLVIERKKLKKETGL
jgi:DNA primase